MDVGASGFANTVYDGSFVAAAGIAALVGLISFLSPCVLPLVPGYLSYVAGLAGSGERPSTRRMIIGASLFIAGFTAIYIALGAVFGGLGGAINDHLVVLERVFGGITIVLGLVFVGQVPLLQREFRVHRLPRAGFLGAPLLGVTFGLVWAPCQTPTLGAVTSLATNQATAGRGALLMVFYCIGLGVPFLVVAAGFGWVAGALTLVRQHRRALTVVGGGLLVGIGLLLLTGLWTDWITGVQARLPSPAFTSEF